MNESGTVRLSKKQIEFLLNFTGENDVQEAMEMFATAMLAEYISPTKMPDYLDKLMQKTGSVR